MKVSSIFLYILIFSMHDFWVFFCSFYDLTEKIKHKQLVFENMKQKKKSLWKFIDAFLKKDWLRKKGLNVSITFLSVGWQLFQLEHLKDGESKWFRSHKVAIIFCVWLYLFESPYQRSHQKNTKRLSNFQNPLGKKSLIEHYFCTTHRLSFSLS